MPCYMLGKIQNVQFLCKIHASLLVVSATGGAYFTFLLLV